MYYRIAETFLVLFEAGCVVGFVMVAFHTPRRSPSFWPSVILSLAFLAILSIDLGFYMGNPQILSWPFRTLMVMGLSFIAVSLWLWQIKKEKNHKSRNPAA